MIVRIEDLFLRKIVWREETKRGVQFYAYVDGELCQLRMNDFPQEPLYTVTWKDFSVDLDDRPNGWIIPH